MAMIGYLGELRYDTTMSSSEIQLIVARIDEIIRNKGSKPLDQLGSYIVGATLTRDDIESYYEAYPSLEKVADLGADLETLADTEFAEQVFSEIKAHLDVLKLEIQE